MNLNQQEREKWLDLSDAADYLGVHFTTLRRWADAGQIPYLRTPGRRRRFSVHVLDAFIQQMQQGGQIHAAAIQPLQERAIVHTRENLRNMPAAENWIERIDQSQRSSMKGTGHLLMALLLQYNSRNDGGDAYLDEGRRIMREYSQICTEAGLSLQETVRIFLFFRSSILDAVYETGSLVGGGDLEGRRIFHRSTDFLDTLILELIGGFTNSMTISK